MRRAAALLLITATALAACSSNKKVNSGATTPEQPQLVVIPLSMPPDYYLVPAQIEAKSKNQSANQDTESDASAPGSAGEQAFLADAGADKSNPDIRGLVNQDASPGTVASPDLINKLIFGDSDQSIPAAPGAAKATIVRMQPMPLQSGSN